MKTYLSAIAAKIKRGYSLSVARFAALFAAVYAVFGVAVAHAQTATHPITELLTEADLPATKDAIQAGMIALVPITLLWFGWKIYRIFIRQAGR
jgi:hypothetical protein